jgi:hypothetical protein
VYYDGTPQLVDATAPVLGQALAVGEHVALACSDSNNRALAEALGDDDRIVVLPRPEIYQKAATGCASWERWTSAPKAERWTSGAAMRPC